MTKNKAEVSSEVHIYPGVVDPVDAGHKLRISRYDCGEVILIQGEKRVPANKKKLVQIAKRLESDSLVECFGTDRGFIAAARKVPRLVMQPFDGNNNGWRSIVSPLQLSKLLEGDW
jgi:hypothetical protein